MQLSTIPTFQNEALLVKALTHRSALNENTSSAEESNERLEFLGDAVLELITTKFLFEKFTTKPEGILTAYRSALVKTTTLAHTATKLGLGQALFMSKGEEATGGRTNEGLLADTMEAVIGALFLDQGIEVVTEFLMKELFTEIDDILENKLYKDPKSHLQEVVQALGFETPDYQVTTEKGPDHDKEFTVQVFVNGKSVAIGTGSSKQRAQQDAAQKALKKYPGAV
ncbi:MAG: ribonuclease III [Candidatus Pacebacteria bacterium]|nr:ribonuclease III [Candidatus Paceibacterota bacterium]PIR64240.1 MAG: ribonuclease III [Candidatus Pacebacteria bacterium CG10_big_fil_rev_8_21_14_0_10_40_26]PIZ79059.1 MAG: ribonuclease III [Candidatus Pacebacteria bacterium CG_4_10_14_0_2_um_filter_40_20]PJA69253.1 MAG: ribonuclease III [Candidatus Pacebacteria bacterium CG_4_9_14_3_um_filter_40_12]PJC42025.1 MAG: ribonuclease III [Candidatus Pacebacteria bacterium CG_4_9_14_0_2_um_filter_40_15]